MRGSTHDRAGQHRRDRKTRDRALILLLIGLALVMPPVAGVFHLDTKLGGIPVTLIYLFVVWALLILGALRLAGALRAMGGASGPPGDDR